eukprot:6516604-Prymnesium_polylepis.1
MPRPAALARSLSAMLSIKSTKQPRAVHVPERERRRPHEPASARVSDNQPLPAVLIDRHVEEPIANV